MSLDADSAEFHQGYAEIVAEQLGQRAADAAAEARGHAPLSWKRAYQCAQAESLGEALSILARSASSRGIPLAAIGLEGVDPVAGKFLTTCGERQITDARKLSPGTAAYADFLKEAGVNIRRRAHESTEAGRRARGGEKEAARESPEDGRIFGRLMGYYSAVSAMIVQAEAWGMPLEALGLEDLDPDRDLL